MEQNRRAQVVDQVLALFWAKGISATSYPDIVAATGLSRKGLYGTWPEKTALVHETFAAYEAGVLSPQRGLLDPIGREALARLWDDIEEKAEGAGWNGCYLMRSASGEMRGDAVVQALYRDHVDALHGQIKTCLVVSGSGTVRAETAARSAVALIGMISTEGGQDGDSPQVADLIAAGRATCGITA